MLQSFSARDSFGDEEMWDDPFEETYIENDPYGCFLDDDRIEMKAGSATDFTGLIPALPESDAELESYAQMYDYPGDIMKD